MKCLPDKVNRTWFIKTAAIIIALLLVLPIPSLGSSLNDTKGELDKVQEEIKDLEERLKAKRTEVKTLKGQLSYIDDQINTIQRQINLYQTQIDLTLQEIKVTDNQITVAQEKLEKQQEILGQYIKELYAQGSITTLEMIAGSNSFSAYLNKVEYVEVLQEKVNKSLNSIKVLKSELELKKKNLEDKKITIKNLQDEELIKKQVIDVQRQLQSNLVIQTKGQETEYQKQLSEAQTKQSKVFAKYMAALRASTGSNVSQYKGGSGTGYLKRPSNGVVTQDYGCTAFAGCGNTNGAYGGKIHNGIDISYGYAGPIYAAAEGVVLDIGYEYNSYGWGNWIAIQHPNGLVTLYAHLSRFAVGADNAVVKGQIIGYEGNTGFSTGSHLHFSVYTNFVIYNGIYHGPGYDGTVNPWDFL